MLYALTSASSGNVQIHRQDNDPESISNVKPEDWVEVTMRMLERGDLDEETMRQVSETLQKELDMGGVSQ